MKFIAQKKVFFLGFCAGILAFFLFLMILTKPASAQWTTWPSAFATRLLTKTTAAQMREYLGITVGSPGESTDGTSAEITGNTSDLYFSLGDDVWVRVAVTEELAVIKLEDTGYALLESDIFMFAE